MKKLMALFIALGLTINMAHAELTYEEAVNGNSKVLVIFGAEWCPHCNTLKNDLQSMNLDGYALCLVDADERKDLIKEHKLKSYPTAMVFSEGKEISRKIGYDKKEFEKWLNKNRRGK